MNSPSRHDAYRAASDAAYVEMNDILNQIETLQLRRTQIEKISIALRPLLELDQQLASSDQRAPHASFERDYPAAPRAVPEVSSDPLERQINYALGNTAVA